MPSILKAIASCIAFLLLAGCANTAAIRSESGLKLSLDAKNKEGYVILKVITLRPISLLSPNWKNITVSSNGNQSTMLNILPPYNMLMGKHIPTESLYFAKLEAGEYDITEMGSVGAGNLGLIIALMTTDRATVTQKLHFTVQAGRLANLGTIVFAPKIENESAQELFLLNGPVGKKSSLDTLLYESIESGVPLVEGGGWTNSTTSEAETTVLEKARPLVSLLTIRNSSNGLEAGTNLGLIYRRTGPQKWSSESIDTLDRIYSVNKTQTGKAIAGSDYGVYYVKSNDGVWSSFRLAQETGRVIHVEPRPDGSAIFVTGDLLKTRVWFKPKLEGSDTPTEIAKIDGPPDNLLITDDEIILAGNIPGMIRDTILSRINKQTLAVNTKKENFWVLDWQYMQDGTVKLTRMNGLSLYSSTWIENRTVWKHEEKAGMFSFWSDQLHGVAIKSSAGFTMVSNQLQITTDGGKTWSLIGKPLDTRDYPGRIVYADESEIILQGSNMLYSTVNKGQTWQRIFPLQFTH